MRPVGGPSSSYYPPMPEAERSNTPPAGTHRSRTSQTGSSQAASQTSQAPTLGNVKRYPAGRHPDMDAEKIRTRIERQEPAKEEAIKHTRRRRPEGTSSSHVQGTHSVASTSAQAASRSDTAFKANDLAELASWTESAHCFSLDPSSLYGAGSNMPSTAAAKILDSGKSDLKDGLAEYGLKIDDVVVSKSRNRVRVNLNYLEMNHYLGRAKGLWIASDGATAPLISKANRYLDDFKAQDKAGLAPLDKLQSKDSLGVMSELLQDSPGLVIGEAHSSVASKRELIKNMANLKAQGVSTLYMEHICADSHGKALNEYMNSPKGSPMPARLKAYLDMQTVGNRGLGKPPSKYNFTTLLEAAKQAGLEVVALDTAKTYATSEDDLGNTRIKVMNYYAAEKIRLHQPEGKWIAFVGSGHATTYEGVPGLAELQGVRSLIIDDHGARSKPSLEVNVKDYAGKLNPDATLSYKV